jgi:hypothetical protein
LERSSEEDVGITENVFALKRPAQAGVVRERSSKKPAASAHPPGRGRHGSAHPDHRGSQSRSGGKGNERERKRQGRKDGQITRPVKRPFFWRGLFGVSTARCRRCPDKLSSAAATPPLIRKARPTPRRSRTRASGSSRSCWPRSSTAPGRPRAKSGIRSSRACGKTSNGHLRRGWLGPTWISRT